MSVNSTLEEKLELIELNEINSKINIAFKRIDEIRVIANEACGEAHKAFDLAKYVGSGHAQVRGMLSAHKVEVEKILADSHLEFTNQLVVQKLELASLVKTENNRVLKWIGGMMISVVGLIGGLIALFGFISKM